MQSNMKSILGIGNAITDIPVLLPDNTLLHKLGLVPGSFSHINAAKDAEIWDRIQGYPLQPVPGGSAANTAAAAAKLGMRCGFIGKAGADHYAALYREAMAEDGVETCLLSGSLPSARAVTFITSNTGERTFATYLGAALEFSADELCGNVFRKYDYLHIEGYLMQCPDVVETAVEIAKGRGMIVSFDMGSVGIVKNFRSRVERIVADFADIVFANEDEALAFTGRQGEEAVRGIHSMMGEGIAVVKQGEKGSLVLSGRELCRVAAVPAEAVDTTGAGDVYAAGFLFAHSMGADAVKCGEAGSLLASKVVAVVGPKIGKSGWKVAKAEIEALLK